ncbi:hypothetical protein [Absiella sp. AM29-15]|nr:hypothetical protein [Absiella sp. AM29-15]
MNTISFYSITPDDLIGQPIIYSDQRMVKNIISGWMKKDYDKYP